MLLLYYLFQQGNISYIRLRVFLCHFTLRKIIISKPILIISSHDFLTKIYIWCLLCLNDCFFFWWFSMWNMFFFLRNDDDYNLGKEMKSHWSHETGTRFLKLKESFFYHTFAFEDCFLKWDALLIYLLVFCFFRKFSYLIIPWLRSWSIILCFKRKTVQRRKVFIYYFYNYSFSFSTFII